MAGHDLNDRELIERYLQAIRARVAWRNDRDEVLDELADHLHSAVDREVNAGVANELAQRRVLEAFGDPDVVAGALARVGSAARAAPSRMTQLAGAAGIVAGLGWMSWGVLLVVSSAALLVDKMRFDTLAAWMTWGGFTLVALLFAPLSCVAALGMFARAGRSRRDVWRLAAAATAVALPVLGLLGWYGDGVIGTVMPWLIMIAPVVFVAAGVWGLRRRGSPMGTDWLVLLAWPLSGAVLVGIDLLGVVPPRGLTAGYEVDLMLGIAVAPLLFGFALLARSSRAASEPAASDESAAPLRTARAAAGVAASGVGVLAALQAVAYLGAAASGTADAGVLFVESARPAFAAALAALVLLPSGIAAMRSATRSAMRSRAVGDLDVWASETEAVVAR